MGTVINKVKKNGSVISVKTKSKTLILRVLKKAEVDASKSGMRKFLIAE